MNISDMNNKIYGYKSLRQGEYANFIMESIEQQEMFRENFNDCKNNISGKFDVINKEIKF